MKYDVTTKKVFLLNGTPYKTAAGLARTLAELMVLARKSKAHEYTGASLADGTVGRLGKLLAEKDKAMRAWQSSKAQTAQRLGRLQDEAQAASDRVWECQREMMKRLAPRIEKVLDRMK